MPLLVPPGNHNQRNYIWTHCIFCLFYFILKVKESFIKLIQHYTVMQRKILEANRNYCLHDHPRRKWNGLVQLRKTILHMFPPRPPVHASSWSPEPDMALPSESGTDRWKTDLWRVGNWLLKKSPVCPGPNDLSSWCMWLWLILDLEVRQKLFKFGWV